MVKMSTNTIMTHVTLMSEVLRFTIIIGRAMMSVYALRAPTRVPGDATVMAVHLY
jgi:hypothetical protein